MKKKLFCFKSLLFVAAFCAALGACRSDELAVREPSQARGAVAEQADTFSLQLDLPSLDFRDKITAVSDVTVADEANADPKNTRAALKVNQDGTTTINLTTENKPITVFLILRSHDGKKVYVSPGNNWQIVNGATTKVEASGKYRFTAVKGGAFAFNKDEVWFLDAMTGGEWNAAKKAYEINKTCAIPSKMFNPGESLRLGTNMADSKTDIVVPFLLGTDEVGRAGERKWGVRMAVANDDRNSNNLNPRLVCIDAAPNFKPYGSLLCMRFRNAIGVEKGQNVDVDPLLKLRKAIPSFYSYVLREIHVESTSSTPGGAISVDKLGAPERDILPWTPYKVGGQVYTFAKKMDAPFKSESYFANVKKDNYLTGYPLKKGKLENGKVKEAGPPTPYYYLWVKSLDEDQNRALYGSSGLKVSCTMYNSSLRPETLGGKRAMTSRRVFVSSTKTHKTSRAYFSDKALDGEIFFPATYYMAPEILYNHPRWGLTWPDSAASNVDVSERSRLFFRNFRDKFGGKEEFDVNVHRGPNDDIGTSTRIKWIVPTRKMVESVFPPKLPGINEGQAYTAGKMEKRHEMVSIGGRMVEADSYYYNPWAYHSDQSLDKRNYHVYYGLRFVGTPYCEAVRYTLYGQWNAPASATLVPGSSRFIIHSKHLGDVSFTEQEAREFFEQTLKSPVQPSPNPRPLGTPPENEFWGKFWERKPDDDVNMTILHLGGRRGLRGGNGSVDLGRALSIVAIENGSTSDMNRIKTSLFEIFDANRSSEPYDFRDWNTNIALAAYARGTVLPFLSPFSAPDDVDGTFH